MSASQVNAQAAIAPPAQSVRDGGGGGGRGVPGRDAGVDAAAGGGAAAPAGKSTLFDLSGIDLTARALSRQQLERWNPHRGQMAMLDWVIWHTPDFKRGIGLKHIRDDEFWVPGHFPERAMFPGVLMVESGAQLASFLYNIRFPEPKIAAFIRLEDASFRAAVVPGDDLYLLCQEVKFNPRRFSSDVQGLVDGKVVFEARITGMAL